MNTTYKIGQDVIANTAVQGLVKGGQYRVVDTIVNHAPWGTFVTYIVAGHGTEDFLHVRNGHLLLNEV